MYFCHVSADTMSSIGVKLDLFKSILNLRVIRGGFYAYLHSKNKAALFH